MDKKYKIYCWWLNKEDMSENRKSSLEKLKNLSECEIIFITRDTLQHYILPEYPLHEGFKYLSEIQQGDYLKCYFMHHYGGGYSDIKQTIGSWVPFFDRLYSNHDLYAIGYQEREVGHVARLENCILKPSDSKFCRDFTLSDDGLSWSSEHIRNNWFKLIGNGNFICKKNTPLTKDWWDGLNEKMDGYLEYLKQNPAKWGRDCYNHINPTTGEKSNYPIKWAVLNGNIFHPLTLKYSSNIEKNFYYPIMTNYQ